ncbi:MAG TPA: FkbM family methyltransferase [Actinokineospora sp.]|jgi:FkbM family methyltransferase|nr:FkbM family methyltransferase [Actinokineospora sp.]
MSSGLSSRIVTAAVSKLSGLVPDRVFTSVIAATYPRFELELARLADFCPTHGTALDIGAWYGPWSRAFARRLDRVVAVEPNPKLAAMLTKTVPANVTVIRSAITDKVGHGTLFVPGQDAGAEAVASMLPSADTDGITVATTTIDDIAPRDVSIIKIDVEGAEFLALRGATEVLTERRPTLLIELEYRRSPVDEIVEYLAGFGYTGRVLVEGAWRPLAGYDLADHQRRLLPQVDSRGYLDKVVRGGPHYINNVIFDHE